MPGSLLDSQLETLEPLSSDEAGFGLDIAQEPDEIASQAAALLAARQQGPTPQ